jgi:translocation protein SEC63
MNYEKYGHPDGPQGTNIGIALPSWMFNKDRKTAPLLLLGLVGGCILLPLAIVSYYMLKVRGAGGLGGEMASFGAGP